MSPVERAALILTLLPFLTLGLAHIALRRLKTKPGMTLISGTFLMLRQIGRLAGWVTALFLLIWLAVKYLDPAALAAVKAEPRSVLVLMGSAGLAYLYLFIRFCWQIRQPRHALQEPASWNG